MTAVNPILAGVVLALVLLVLVLSFGKRPKPKSKVRKPHLKQDTEEETTDDETAPDAEKKSKSSRLWHLIHIAALVIVGLAILSLASRTEWWPTLFNWSGPSSWDIGFRDVVLAIFVAAVVGLAGYGGLRIWIEKPGKAAKRFTEVLIGCATGAGLIIGVMMVIFGPAEAWGRLDSGLTKAGKWLDNAFESKGKSGFVPGTTRRRPKPVSVYRPKYPLSFRLAAGEERRIDMPDDECIGYPNELLPLIKREYFYPTGREKPDYMVVSTKENTPGFSIVFRFHRRAKGTCE